ncbi:MAG: ParA family protein [Spirochaetaceae bacterium]|nr:MAG: ParA family protein [Spirochaetaceae bacterium]
MGKIVVFANQKGGVGKTTTAVNLGAYLAEASKRVLLIDFDPQANSSSSLGIDGRGRGIYELLIGSIQPRDVVQETKVPGLFIIASSIHLTGATVELINMPGREYLLKKAIEELRGDFDYLFIDCPPSLGLLTVNGLVAADAVIIPLQCEYFAMEGLSKLLKTIQRVQQKLNPGLKIGGILFTMFDSRTRLANEVVKEVSSYFKENVFTTIIPRNVRLSEAPSFARPINQYDPECIGARSYRRLAQEVLEHV